MFTETHDSHLHSSRCRRRLFCIIPFFEVNRMMDLSPCSHTIRQSERTTKCDEHAKPSFQMRDACAACKRDSAKPARQSERLTMWIVCGSQTQ